MMYSVSIPERKERKAFFISLEVKVRGTCHIFT